MRPPRQYARTVLVQEANSVCNRHTTTRILWAQTHAHGEKAQPVADASVRLTGQTRPGVRQKAKAGCVTADTRRGKESRSGRVRRTAAYTQLSAAPEYYRRRRGGVGVKCKAVKCKAQSADVPPVCTSTLDRNPGHWMEHQENPTRATQLGWCVMGPQGVRGAHRSCSWATSNRLMPLAVGHECSFLHGAEPTPCKAGIFRPAVTAATCQALVCRMQTVPPCAGPAC